MILAGMDKALEVQNLKVIFKSSGSSLCAVDDISFDLHRAEFLGVVGESGSGKTVMALSVMKLIPTSSGVATSGVIVFSDHKKKFNLLEFSEKEFQRVRGSRISMVFQEPMSSLNPVYTCGRQVQEMLSYHRKMGGNESREMVLELFREVLLPRPRDIYRSFPHELSGGQKQRVMIAMAIACDPAILIADEPTTALDISVQRSIMKLLKTLQEQRGMAILFITHDLGLVYGFADRAAVMMGGKIVEQGVVYEIFSRPQHQYTKGLLSCRPVMGVKPRRLPTIQEFLIGDKHENVSGICYLSTDSPVQSETILQVTCLSKHYWMRSGSIIQNRQEIHALNPVSFEVKRGETLGIVGESGSGKTTLARTLLELVPPTTGRVVFKGEEITSLSKRQYRRLRKEMQIIFQDPFASLNPRMTIGNAILEPMKFHKLHYNSPGRGERMEYLLNKVGIEPSWAHRYPHEFSGGQRQRICIARALAVEPDLIICDESVSALDVSIQAQVLNLLNDLKNEFSLTYIFISHDLAVVRYMSDRMLVMKDGKIEESGDCETIFNSPGSSYTKSLLEALSDTSFHFIPEKNGTEKEN